MFKRFLRPAKQLACTLIFALSANFSANAENISIIHAGKLLAIPGEAAKSKQTVVIKNGKIALFFMVLILRTSSEKVDDIIQAPKIISRFNM